MSLKLATHLFDVRNSIDASKSGYSHFLRLPITEIDGIECNFRFVIFRDSLVIVAESYFSLFAPDEENPDESTSSDIMFYKRYFAITEDTTVENITETLDKWFAEISNLKFDKLCDYGADHNAANAFVSKERCGIFDFMKNTTLKIGEECCVCYDLTSRKTICGHCICIPCLSKMKGNEDNELVCPVCRETIGSP